MWTDSGEVREAVRMGETSRNTGFFLPSVQMKHQPGLLEDCVQVAGETGRSLGAQV